MLERKIIDAKTVVSKMRYNNTVICIKSFFNGEKHIDDIFFNLAKERLANEKKL